MSTVPLEPSLPTTRSASAQRRRARWPYALVALVASGGLAVSLGVQLARGAIASRLTDLAGRYGLVLEAGDIDVPLVGSIGLRRVSIKRASDGRPVAELEALDTDLTLVGAALGDRRPGALTLRGGRALLRWDDGLADLTRPAPVEGAAAGPTEALTLRVEDLEVGIELRHTTPLGPVSADAIELVVTEATLTRGADRDLSLAASGRVSASGHEGRFEAKADQRAGTASLSFPDGAQLGLTTPRGPAWVALDGLEHAASGTSLRGLGLLHEDLRVALGALELRPEAPLAPGASPLELARALTTIEARGLTLARGGDLLTLGRGALTFTPHPDGWPSPTRARASELGVTLAAAERDLRVEGRVASLEVDLAAPEILRGHLEQHAWLDAVTGLRVKAPVLEVVLPARVAAPAALGEAPQANGDDPPPFLGNDDELPPAEAVVPALAPGRDWLGALLGSSDGVPEGSSSLVDLLPETLRARLPKLLARASTLAPTIEQATISVRDTAGATLLALDEAGFSARATDRATTTLAAKAAVRRNAAEVARLDFEVELAPDLTLEVVSGKVSGRSLAHQLARFVPQLSVQEDAGIDLELRYTRPKLPDAPHHVEGRLAFENFSFEFWRIADREIRDLEAAVVFDASIDRKHHRLLLDLPTIEVGEARMKASLDLTRKRGRLPSFVARVEMPRQDCGAAARSIPKGLIPNLSTLATRGELDFKASLTLDLANPRGLDLEVEGSGEDCQILSLGPGIEPAALRGPYVHHPREPKGVLEHIAVGPGTPEWVPTKRIPELVLLAAWVTEDRRWEEHAGVRWDLVERALKIDLEHGRFIYGGSTITQQLVKNLYLTRTKNLARKLEEAIIAWQMERVLTKEEILTLYVNCIEYGPEIYGIKQAARLYFGKRPDDLDAIEAAFIMGLKPYPKAGYNQFKRGELDQWWVKRVSHVLRMMAKYGPQLITLEEAEAFAPFQPSFREP